MPDPQPWWESLPAIVTAITTACGALAAAIVSTWRRLRPVFLQWRHEKRAGISLRDQELMRIKLRAWRLRSRAMRGLLMAARNCGWTDPAKPVKISIVTESEDDDVPTVYEQWQAWDADPAYKSMLHDVCEAQGRGVLVLTSTLLAGRLRDHYRSQGIVASIVFLMGFDADGAMLFVSLNFGDPMLGLSHPAELHGGAAEPSEQWSQLAADHLNRASRLDRDPELTSEMRIVARRIWFGHH